MTHAKTFQATDLPRPVQRAPPRWQAGSSSRSCGRLFPFVKAGPLYKLVSSSARPRRSCPGIRPLHCTTSAPSPTKTKGRAFHSRYQASRTIPVHHQHNNELPLTASEMPFFYSKAFGGRHFGTSVHADRHGVRRGPWRFSLGRFNCFKHRH
ncbi:hypothetical protein GGTG_10399 [Gaeumannomyces tritici R3-111a-1]|uniref:Uncharacterized protein n=1 Tax=Gaeumannomyces tritici (strain R3-111a-1) TaxID=644352 RepID=J3PA73_GAET3|nr:hypothetical protein GGTG_10399 [Gaeumannomyces tritici R3-111a-1]EJT71139.1 hypothetical protein GGTG_10399 [Gaeumannomyces tritici R3-111a-1]